MRVLMFGWEFPPYISGGLGTACFGLTRSLVEQDVQISFVLPRIKGEKAGSHVTLIGANEVTDRMVFGKFMGVDNLEVLEVDSTIRPYINDKQYQEYLRQMEKDSLSVERDSIVEISGDYGKNLIEEIYRYALVGGRLGTRKDFDLIHAHDWMTFPAAVEAKRASGKPLVVHVHATEFDRSGERPNQKIYDIERMGVEAADKIIAVSHRTKNMLIEKYGVSPDKIYVVHNAVIKDKSIEREHAGKNLSEKIVLFLGRITMQKGPEYFVEAAARVIREYENVRFVMAGAGDMLPKMIERMAELRMADKFHFTGFLSGSDLERMYAMSDIYVMPSVSEPFGITPFEAIKYGVPVIISKQSGVSEVLPHAIKIDFWDIDELSRSIVRVLKDNEYAKSMVENNTRQLNDIDWRWSASKVIDVYTQVMQ